MTQLTMECFGRYLLRRHCHYLKIYFITIFAILLNFFMYVMMPSCSMLIGGEVFLEKTFTKGQTGTMWQRLKSLLKSLAEIDPLTRYDASTESNIFVLNYVWQLSGPLHVVTRWGRYLGGLAH